MKKIQPKGLFDPPQKTSDQTSVNSQKSNQTQVDESKKKSRSLTSLRSMLDAYQIKDKGGYISQEFQDFGYRLAVEFNDLAHKSLYIRMAKKIDRSVLERAKSFVSDANAKSKAKLFMWKVKELRKEAAEKAEKAKKDKKTSSKNVSDKV